MKEFTPLKKSVVLAADVPTLGSLENLVKEVQGIEGISAFKIGFTLGLKGLEKASYIARGNSTSRVNGIKIIYDHQKAGNDIPDTGVGFAEALVEAGVDGVILFPFTGPKTQYEWTKACQNVGLDVFVGGMMTHPEFLISEGGYISDDAPERIYKSACDQGVEHFIVPGNKLYWVRKIRNWIAGMLGEGNYTLSAPGLIEQGGDVSECGLAAGDNWHAIVGRAIFNASNIKEAALNVTKQVL